jgi:hypothetical protein
MVAVVDIWKTPGNISKTLVLSQTHVSHTLLVTDQKHHAPPSALMVHHGPSTNAPQVQLLTQPALLRLNQKSTTTAQLKLPSQSMKTSTVTPQEPTSTLLEVSSEVTPLSSSDTELMLRMLTIGSLPTPGDQDGESKEPSTLNKETAVSTTKSSLAPQKSLQLNSESLEIIINLLSNTFNTHWR